MPNAGTDLYKIGEFLGEEFGKVHVSLSNTEQELKNLINLRATIVALSDVEDRVESLETENGDGGGNTETDSYTENTFTNGVLSGQSKYTAQGGTLLETKTFTYTSGNLTQIVVKDGSNVTTLTQTIAYDGDGNVSSITKDYA